MSDGSATRRNGTFCSDAFFPSSLMSCEIRGVHTKPGATAFARIPFGPSSTASVRTHDISPAFAAP